MLEALGYVVALTAAIVVILLLPFCLWKIPKLKASVSARLGVSNDPRRRWLRCVTGVAAVAGLPLYGYAFSYAAIPALAIMFAKPLAGWPARTKSLAIWSAAGVVALLLSAMYQQQPVSGNILYYTATALFIVAGVKLTSGEASAAQLLGWGAMGSAMFFVLFKPKNTDTFEHLWKYGIGPYVAIVCVWMLCALTHRRLIPAVALLVVGSASLFLGFRSHGLVCFFTAVILITKGRSSKGGFPFFRLIVGAGALYSLYRILPAAVESGVFGEAVRLRTASQLGEDGPAFLAGRVEPPLSIAAISEKWLFGWGNLDAIDFHTISEGADIAYSMGLLPKDFMHLWVGLDGKVSVHSLLGEGWAEGGVVGAALPMLLLLLFLAAIWRCAGSWAPLVILVSALGIWDVLFSTWAYGRPLTLAFSAVVAAWAISTSKASINVADPSDDHGPTDSAQSNPSRTKVTASRHQRLVDASGDASLANLNVDAQA
ncbi:hypothetical protein [Arthrobacter sp. UYCo732]|uniref:hypothetical protein n=1 Tax=Arthrobacter sp. UYCo732 TaxID=3156336 RepID=UPI00339B4FC2